MRTIDRSPRPRSERHDRASRRRPVPPRPFRRDGRSERRRRSDRCRPHRDRRRAAAACMAGGAEEPSDDDNRTVAWPTDVPSVGIAHHPRPVVRDHCRRLRDRHAPAACPTARERTDRVRPIRAGGRRHRHPHRQTGRLRDARPGPRPERMPAILPGRPDAVARLRHGEHRRHEQARIHQPTIRRDARLLDVVSERDASRGGRLQRR